MRRFWDNFLSRVEFSLGKFNIGKSSDIKTLKELPTLNNNNIIDGDYPAIRFDTMTAPIMQGKDAQNRKFIAFRLRVTVTPEGYQHFEQETINSLSKDENQNHIVERVLILFQRYEKFPKYWTTSFSGLSFLTFPFFKSPFTFNMTNGMINHENSDKDSMVRLKQLIDYNPISDDHCTYQLV